MQKDALFKALNNEIERHIHVKVKYGSALRVIPIAPLRLPSFNPSPSHFALLRILVLWFF